MKSTELPINTLIIIILAIIVLIAILGFFYGIWPHSTQSIDIETAKYNACQTLVSMRCLIDPKDIRIDNFDADKDGNAGTAETGNGWTWGDSCPTLPTDMTSGDNLASLCACYYSANTASDCKTIVCGCSS